MTTRAPTRKPTITVQEIGAEILLYDAEAETVHTLNPTAKLIWDLCDGTHTPAEMAQSLRANFAIAADHDVSADVRQTLAVFVAKGLLQE